MLAKTDVLDQTQTSSPERTGLECRVGRARILVPVDAVARIVEYRTVPLPLSKRLIAGIGMHEGLPIVSITLVPPNDVIARGVIRAILLNVPASPIGWGLEVNEVFVFVRAKLQPRKEPNPKIPRWIHSSATEDGRQLAWVDVATMLLDLADVKEAT